METLRWAIMQQARFEIVALLGAAGVVLAGGLVAFGLIKLGLPERLVIGVSASVLAVGVTAAVIYYFSGPQGAIELEGSYLVVKPRLRAPKSILVADATFERGMYRERMTGRGPYVVGPMLTIADRETTFSLGCPDPALATRFAAEPRHDVHVPPSFMVSCADFTEIVERLGLELSHAEATP